MIRDPIVSGLRLAAWRCVGLLAILSLLPAEEMARTSLGGHVEHAMAYAGTAVLARFGYPQLRFRWTVLALVIYAGFLEYLQHFAVERSPAVEDWLASSMGVLFGAGAAHWMSRVLRHSRHPGQSR